ncbi:uncharacterized protein LOC130214272 [Danio aesculapii]|uniref:uncharacterized protein LOC130214272 n=1 Tax=Danio aesculapii TaxID=1142201 RepID=UPI0024BFF01E|nr:uncharacterized protein LOC130214272 [Danio aesculapii]
MSSSLVSTISLSIVCSGSLEIVLMIYIIVTLLFICALLTYFYLKRQQDKQVTQGQNEDLEVEATQMNETEKVKQADKVSVQDEERGNTEKANVTAATDENKTLVDSEQVEWKEEFESASVKDYVLKFSSRSEMKFSSRLLFGLLMSCLYFRGSSELCVNQSPSSITVNEGVSAQISCCWNTSTHSVKVVWYINEKKLSDPKQELQEHQIKSCSTLHITNILKNDTGHYVCEVTQDIPLLVKKNGTGTNVSVSISELETTTAEVSHQPETTQASDTTLDPNTSSTLVSTIVLSTFCSGSSELCVNQRPSSITVNKGESAQISCCWSTSTHSVKVVWYFNETKLSDPKQELQEHQIKSCSTLHIINILNNDTGHYVCEVTQDIPLLVKKNGTGTNVSVIISELETTNDNNYVVSQTPVVRGNSSLGNVVMIYIFRSLPFICLLSAFFYLNKTYKQVAQLKPADGDAVESGEGQNEDLEVEETQMNETEEVKQGDKISVQKEGRGNTEKAEDTAATEDEKQENHEVKETFVDTEQVPVTDNEH